MIWISKLSYRVVAKCCVTLIHPLAILKIILFLYSASVNIYAFSGDISPVNFQERVRTMQTLLVSKSYCVLYPSNRVFSLLFTQAVHQDKETHSLSCLLAKFFRCPHFITHPALTHAWCGQIFVAAMFFCGAIFFGYIMAQLSEILSVRTN